MGDGKRESLVTDMRQSPIGEIRHVATRLRGGDRVRNLLVRLGVNRENYRIQPGIYGVGEPRGESPVLVTSNYKLTFDALRKELGGISAWILVLDTNGINVWCAAGKRTFSTAELVARCRESGLERLVSHRTLILPQLGAPGVRAHDVHAQTGFRVVYGPVRACDIPAFLHGELKKTESMRTVRFPLKDRLVLIPVELALALVVLAAGFLLTVGTDWLSTRIFSLRRGFIDFVPFLCAVLAGCVGVPILLPYIPVRSFALKGLIIGIVVAALVFLADRPPILLGITTTVLVLTTSSLFALFFTGSTPFTSVSGVRREVSRAFPVLVPLMTVSILAGFVLKIVAAR